MGGKGDEKTVLKPIKPLAVRYNDNRSVELQNTSLIFYYIYIYIFYLES